jgi:hypothetical protein
MCIIYKDSAVPTKARFLKPGCSLEFMENSFLIKMKNLFSRLMIYHLAVLASWCITISAFPHNHLKFNLQHNPIKI